ncbi:MAG TPA: FAD-binding protein [Thermomicrobiales bacterium]|nr:FAD-binding protein [Thermomicrobiales bacterium]
MAESTQGRLRVSRRGFLKASGAGAAVAAGTIGAVSFGSSRAFAQQKWDDTYDVVVVGSGAAAFSAAITAQHLGAKVVMLEKGAYVGGTTLVSGGTMWIPNNAQMAAAGLKDNREDAIRYMARVAFPADYNPEDAKLGLMDHDFEMLSAYYDTGSEAMKTLEDAGAATYLTSINTLTGSIQADYVDHLPEDTSPIGRSIVAATKDGKPGGGGDLIASYQAYAKKVGIPILLGHRVERVVLNDAGEVIGVEVAVNQAVASGTPEAAGAATPVATPAPTQTIAIRANKGVIFGSGGFVRNKDLMRHFVSHPTYGGCSAPTNEGDLIRIAYSVQAKLGNLHNIWRNEGLFEQAIASEFAYNCIWFYNGDSFIMVNKEGKRFVNEKRNYQDRSMSHLTWDSNNATWANLLSFLIYDNRIQENWGTGFPFPADATTSPIVVIGETLEELATKLHDRVDSLTSHTGGVQLGDDFAANLVAEVEKYNGYAKTGIDPDFERGKFLYDQDTPLPPFTAKPTVTKWPSDDQPNSAMYPLSATGPYYALVVAQSAVDTNGGPVINSNGQILNIDEQPIAGLYGAGNCVASPGVNAYWGAGMTLGNAHTWGYAAAKHVVASPEKSA